ncbi:MAG TPA: acyl-CoA dehydrogenase C-terminal domain-containing protein, partial [Burkholderiales bacterium]
VMAWLWLDIALTAQAKAQGAAGADFHRGKIAAARYFFSHELPKVNAWLQVVASRDTTCRDMREAWF